MEGQQYQPLAPTRRKAIILLMLLLSYFGMACMAQAPQQFNYQGTLRQPNGQPLAGKPITLRIGILDGPGGATLYSETRKVTTNQLGLYQLAIGGNEQEITIGKIKDLDWANGAKYLKIEADIDNSGQFEPAGNTQLLSVPYALYAANSPTKATAQPWFSTTTNRAAERNDEPIYQQANVGILTSQPLAALDVRGAVRFGQPGTGAVGAGSAAFGNGNTASGTMATAFGSNNTASGSRSTVFGTMSEVSGHYSTSFGSSNKVSGWMSTAMGGNLEVNGNWQTVFGTNNAQTEGSNVLFQIGNGNPNVPAERSNAITMTTTGQTLLGTSAAMPNSTLQVAGSLSLPIRSIIDGQPDPNDFTLLVKGYVNMPAPAKENMGRLYQLVNDTDGQQLVRGSFRINGREEPGLVLDIQDGHRGVLVQSDGRSWVVLNQF